MNEDTRPVTTAAPASESRAEADDFIAVEGLGKSFGSFVAVDGISFRIGRGNTLALLGPSGCGKTTILRCITGLETPEAGRIDIGGRTVFDADSGTNLMPEKRELGIVFQSYAVWPHMSVADNVRFPLRVRGIKGNEARERVARILDFVGLGDRGDRPATDLSGGQQQRVALARALVHEPTLVLFDEPLSNLDAQLREQMRMEIKSLQDRLGFTAIFVTHDQAEAFALADHVIVMNSGQVEMSASARTVAREPASPFVAQFLGLNVLAGTVMEPEAGSALNPEQHWVDVRLNDGTVLRGACGQDSPPSPGEDAVACMRRENIAVYSANGSGGQDGMSGTVHTATFLGYQQEYILDIGGIYLRAVQADAGLETGDSVTIQIAPRDCIVLRDTL